MIRRSFIADRCADEQRHGTDGNLYGTDARIGVQLVFVPHRCYELSVAVYQSGTFLWDFGGNYLYQKV